MRTLAFLSLMLLCACERIDYIELSPAEVTFKQSNNQTWLEAKCMARNGTRAVKARVNWSVKDPEVAKVDARGLLTPVGDGETEVIARVGDVEARATVKVVYVARVEVMPKELTLKEGDDSAKVSVKAFRNNGKEITGRAVALSSADKKIVQIVGGGAILPLDPGTTLVNVQVDGARASVQVTVEADKQKNK